jgi:predicted DCC family thiol-disulfide oxidoreductase YuxK
MSLETPAPSVFADIRPVVFFDGACPLCRREIAHYRRIDRSERLRWVDASVEADTLAAHDLDLERAMAELHVLDGAWRWHRGVDAFVLIWSRLPPYRWLARLVSLPGLHSLLEIVYRRFAVWRYRRRCGTDGCLVADRTRVR